MMLDYQSLLLALGVSAACLMVTLFGTWFSRRTDSFLLTLAISLCLVVAGIAVYSTFSAQSGLAPAAIAYALFMIGFSTIYAASVQFRIGMSPWRLAGTLSFVSLALGLPLILAGLDGLGLIIMNVLTATLLVGTGCQYWTARKEAHGPLLGMALCRFSHCGCPSVPWRTAGKLGGKLEYRHLHRRYDRYRCFVAGASSVAHGGPSSA